MLKTNQITVVRRLAQLRYCVRDIVAVTKYARRDVLDVLRPAGWRERYRERACRLKVNRFALSLASSDESAPRRIHRGKDGPDGRGAFASCAAAAGPLPMHTPPILNSPAPLAAAPPNRCPLCGAYAFNGEPCQPVCDPGNLRRAGIELLPIEFHPGCGHVESDQIKRSQQPVRFHNTKDDPNAV